MKQKLTFLILAVLFIALLVSAGVLYNRLGDTVGDLPSVLQTENAMPDDITADVQRVFDECSMHENFMISTGCDVPAASKWENIEAYFKKVNELYA